MKIAETIFALSSGGLPSGVAVVRLSGPQAISSVKTLVSNMPAQRKTALRKIRSRNGLVIDQGLVIVFTAPNSFTGEDCVELQVHGGKAVITALLQELAGISGCRLAEPGEFSRRALDNGRLDLVEVEGLADLLSAETEMQRRLAIEHSYGGLSQLYDGWANRITRGRALIEAELDFADEGDVPGSVSDRVWAEMATLRDEVEQHLSGSSMGEIVRDGFKVAICGAPNSGKSTLLNALAQREAAIVTNIPGTTRDVIEVSLDIQGYAVRFFDTAGIRETEDVVELEGIRRTRRTLETADLIFALSEIGETIFDELGDVSASVLQIGTKADLHGQSNLFDICIAAGDSGSIDKLKEIVLAEVERRISGLSLAVPARQRHTRLLADTLVSLEMALNDSSPGLEIRAEFLRMAARSLGRITGRVDVEDLLGVIFSEFCIGK